MRRLGAPLLALLLLLPVVGAAGDDLPDRRPRIHSLDGRTKRRIEELYEAWFPAKPDRRTEILAELAEIGPLADRYVKSFAKDAFKLARGGLRTQGKTERTLDHPDYPGRFLIYGDSARKKKGLLVGLHGGGAGAGDGATAAQKWQSATGQNLVCVFPTVLEKTNSAWNQPKEERYVLELIETVKRTYPIDTNRIYLAGHSMGGYGTWSIGGHHADLFAAISPNAGGLFVRSSDGKTISGLATGILPNLFSTPVYFTHGADDPRVSVEPDRAAAKALAELAKEHPGGFEHEYKEYPDIGHGLPPDGTMPIIKWLVSHVRTPHPEKVVWEPAVAGKTSFFWLRVAAPSPGARIVAVREGNEIQVTTTGTVNGLSVLLSEEAIDFDDPVRITKNGEEAFHGYVHPRADVILESIGTRNDPEMWFSARIDL